MDFDPILQRFEGKPIAVVGDVILDEFVWGAVERISPEAPVPVVRVDRRSFHLGGAANVAANLAALGAVPRLVGIVGDDDSGRRFLEAAGGAGLATGGIVVEEGRRTTLKTRIIAHQQQVCRTDWESDGPLQEATRDGLEAALQEAVAGADALVLSDYAQGVLSDGRAAAAIDAGRRAGLFIGVDPKDTRMEAYRGSSIVTPNRREAERAAGSAAGTDSEVVAVGRRLLELTGAEWMLITRGESGMTLVGAGSATQIPTAAREVFDVSGAGDTVIAALVLAAACGAQVADACRLANQAAGIVVGKVGTASVTVAELRAALGHSG